VESRRSLRRRRTPGWFDGFDCCAAADHFGRADQSSGSSRATLGRPGSSSILSGQPRRSEVPAVSRIVITVPREESDDEEWTGFVPLEDAAGAAATSSGGSGVSMLASMRVSSSAYLATHGIGPGFACATIGHQPRNVIYQSSQGVNYTVHGKSENSCKFGVGVTYMEITSSLQRKRSDGTWQNMASDFSGANKLGGDIAADAAFDCNHNAAKTYRTAALAYTFKSGVGYTGDDYASRSLTCPDSG